MSIFLDILRCILCCDEEEDEAQLRRSRDRNRNNHHLYTLLIRESDSQTTTTTTHISSPNHSNSWMFPESSTTRAVQTRVISNNSSVATKLLPETLAAVSFVKPKATLDPGLQHKSSSVVIKTETVTRTPDKSREATQKPMVLPPTHVHQHRQTLPHHLHSRAVQTSDLSKNNSVPTKLLPETPAVSFVKPKATVDSGVQHKISSVVVRPEAVIRTPDKSCDATQKPKILPTSPSPAHVQQNEVIYLGSNRTSEQTLPHSLLASSSKALRSLSTPPPPPASSSASSSFGTPPLSPKPLQLTTKPTLSLAPSNSTNPDARTSYIWVQKGASQVYAIPEDLKDLIKKDVVPRVLRKPLSLSTYKDYFDALLYAEDYYIEKWDGFEMENVPLELHEAAIYKRKDKRNYWNGNDEKDDKVFVAFEIDSIPERRPFLLSRDFVSVRPSGKNKKAEPFQGLVYRVVKSNRVLVEFGEDFHYQHYSACKYDVKFSFNRVCLKRGHQAIAAASDPLFRNFLFPDSIPNKSSIVPARFESINPKLDWDQVSAVQRILSHQNLPPYLLEGPISVLRKPEQLSRTGVVVCEAILQMYRTSPSCRILVCAPTNRTCDVITRKLKGEIPESDIFRANAAFRELDGVPVDILPTCLYNRECFSCPSLQELRKFKVILSTFMSCFRLHNEGIMAGHFDHIFLVDASSVTEPEAMVALANLANEMTTVTITGAPRNHSGWIRSDMARQNGLMTSYFERLRESKLYKNLDPKVITQLVDSGRNSNDTYSSMPLC